MKPRAKTGIKLLGLVQRYSVACLSIIFFCVAPTIPARSVEQWTAELAAMKEVAQGTLARSNYHDVFNSGDPPGEYDLFSCGSGALRLGLSDNDSLRGSAQYFELADVAAWSVLLDKLLVHLHLEDIGAPYIRRVEAFEVSNLQRHIDIANYDDQKSALLTPMAKELNTAIAARQSNSVKGTAFRVEGGCGAGELLYRIVARPSGAHVRVIKEFYYLLCKASNKPADDPDQCFGWQEAATSRMEGAGSYRYEANWPDGKISMGIFN